MEGREWLAAKEEVVSGVVARVGAEMAPVVSEREAVAARARESSAVAAMAQVDSEQAAAAATARETAAVEVTVARVEPRAAAQAVSAVRTVEVSAAGR